MSETKWAKSPWHVVQYGDGDSLVICSDVDGNWRICFMATHGGSQSSRKRIQAEADLIAAAPDLYAALEEVTDALVATLVFDGWDVHEARARPEVVRARAALGKARGET